MFLHYNLENLNPSYIILIKSFVYVYFGILFSISMEILPNTLCFWMWSEEALMLGGGVQYRTSSPDLD